MSRAMKRPASALPESTSVKSVARLLFGPKRVKVSEDTEEDSEEYTEEDIEQDSEWDIKPPTEDYTAYWPPWYLDIYNEMAHMDLLFCGWSDCESEYESSESTEDAEPAEEPAEDTEPAKNTEPADNTGPAKNTRSAKSTVPAGNIKPVKSTEPAKNTRSAKSTVPAGDIKPAKNIKTAKSTGPAKDTKPAKDAKSIKATGPIKDTGPGKDPNFARNEYLRQGARAESTKPLKTLDEINVDDAKNRDRWRLQLNNQKIKRSADPYLERQIILAKTATELVSKTYELLEQTPREYRPIIWLKQSYDLFCEDHARLFARTYDDENDFGEYEHGDHRTVKFIRFSNQQLEEEGIDERDVPPCGGGQIFQADIRICGGLRGTKLFSIIYANPEPTIVSSWSMGDVAFTWIEDHYFKLRIPRDTLLKGTNIDPSKAPEFFEFVGISKEYQSACDPNWDYSRMFR